MSHRNARLTPAGRRILVERIISGRPVAHVAKEMGISRTCGSNPWLSEDSPVEALMEDRFKEVRTAVQAMTKSPSLDEAYLH